MVKSRGSTTELPLKLVALSAVEVDGMCHVAVKCIDMTQNTDSEGSPLKPPLTLRHESVGSEQD